MTLCLLCQPLAIAPACMSEGLSECFAGRANAPPPFFQLPQEFGFIRFYQEECTDRPGQIDIFKACNVGKSTGIIGIGSPLATR